MAWYRAGGGGIPSALKTDMNAVLNKKFGTSQDYPPTDWAPTVNLLGPLPEKTASGSIVSFDDGADDVPIVSGLFDINASGGGGTPDAPIAIVGKTGLTITHKDNMLTPQQSETITDTFGLTIYGGTRNTNGTLTETISQAIKFNDAGLSWTYQSSYSRFRCQSIGSLVVKPATNQTILAGLLCSCYPASVANSSYALRPSISVNTAGDIFVYDDAYTDVPTWLAAIGNEEFVYPLLTANTYSISKLTFNTYYGANRFVCDTGDASITYRADIQLALNP